MAVRIRLARLGTNQKPFSRIVVAECEAPRDGRYIEVVGYYDPKKGRASATVKRERLLYWLSKGARPTATVQGILKEVQASGPKQKDLSCRSSRT